MFIKLPFRFVFAQRFLNATFIANSYSYVRKFDAMDCCTIVVNG